MKVVGQVVEWAEGKGIVGPFSNEGERNAQQLKQIGKMIEEVQELEEAVALKDYDESVMELGDVLVTCIIQAHLMQVNIEDCINLAYEKISKRNGKLVDGVFVKESV